MKGPIRRSELRLALGGCYFGTRRKLLWLRQRRHFARERGEGNLPYCAASHRHGYDVFPDSDRTQPFGSGATCFYPYGDLMIRNDTEDTWQLIITVGEHELTGEWRCSAAPYCRYEIVEREHEMRAEYWGGYTRHNVLYQQCFAEDGTLLEEKPIVRNDAIMMYSPYLEEGTKDT